MEGLSTNEREKAVDPANVFRHYYCFDSDRVRFYYKVLHTL